MAEKIEELLINIELTVEQVNTILAALSEVALPFKVTSVLIATIKEQGEKQLRQKEFQESEAAELPESAEDSE